MELIDCHTHTQFSVDSEADIEECIERAIGLGLAAYAVTDHCECNRWYSQEHYPGETVYPYFDFGRDFESSLSAVQGSSTSTVRPSVRAYPRIF